MAFFGLTERWNESVALYAHLAGTNVTDVLFAKGRPSAASAEAKKMFTGLALETGWDGGRLSAGTNFVFEC